EIADPARISRTARPGDSVLTRPGTLRPGGSGSLTPVSTSSGTVPATAPAWARGRRGPVVLVVELLVLLIPMVALALWTVLRRPKTEVTEKQAPSEKPVWRPIGFEPAGPRENYVAKGNVLLPPQLVRSVPGLPEDQQVLFVRVDLPKSHGTGSDYIYI